MTEPVKKPMVLYPTRTKATKIPGNIACERASPISDILRNTIKQPITPHIIPTIEDAHIALMAHSDDKVSIKLKVNFYQKYNYI